MKRLVLLILDGDGFRSPGLTMEMDAQGWDLVWVDSARVAPAQDENIMPDLALFDPSTAGLEAVPALQLLRLRNPLLPLAALGGPGEDPGWFDPASLEPLARIPRSTLPAAWPGILGALLRSGVPEKRKFTAEDLFGDILSDLEGPPAPEPPLAPTQPRPVPPSVPAPPRPVPPVVLAPPRPVALPAPVPPRPVPPPAPAPPRLVLPSVPAPSRPAPPPVSAPIPALVPEGGHTLPGAAAPAAAAAAAVADPAPAPVPPPPPGPEDEPVLEQFGNYNLLEKVAVGGMAELFKARQRGVHNFEKIVAIKRILPHLSDNDEFVRMFIDEAKLAAQLSHPNIVQIFDLGKAGGFYYIAMEFVDGRDLRNLLRKVREYKLPMPEVLAAAVIMKVASALDYAHRKRAIDDKELRLVHRDISPQNILISYEGEVKLVDFGIAKAATKSTQTQSGALKGKLLYMSPEQALGQPLDGRSDIYSLGLVLAELLTGERCFQADSELGVLEKVRLGKVVDIRTINPVISSEMGDILHKILQKDVDLRYASARLLERDLKALLAKRGHEPNQHDLAEYVNTLLKGTREEAESLLSARFPPPIEVAAAPRPEPRVQAPAPAGEAADPPTLSGLESAPTAPTAARQPVPRPAPDPVRPAFARPPAVAARKGNGRTWLLAAFGIVAILAVLAIKVLLLK